MFCMADHFEPGAGRATKDVEANRMATLLEKYPQLADSHFDTDGYRPRRTWFFPPHYHRHGNLKQLVSLCARGYGEVELHLHHGKTRPDSAENLERTITSCIADYARFGVFGTENGERRYGFIHGDWALDNSRRNGRYCGVDNEIDVLKRTGCYADFTFPSCNEANPSQINSIYYAREDGRRRSHKRGAPARVGIRNDSDLLIVQGPLHPIRLNGSFFALRAFGDDVAPGKPGSRRRVDHWVRTWIHVVGREEWIFVKVHTHGATDSAVVLGEEMDATFRYLEDAYNDGGDSLLHYVTARELYNIVCAAECGETGNPGDYRDYRVARPVYDSSPAIMEACAELRKLVAKTYVD
jgi:hypothetical protein